MRGRNEEANIVNIEASYLTKDFNKLMYKMRFSCC